VTVLATVCGSAAVCGNAAVLGSAAMIRQFLFLSHFSGDAKKGNGPPTPPFPFLASFFS